MSKLEETLAILAEARLASPSAIVAFSGGKDSLVVMDLACRTFDNVVGLFKYSIPGMRYASEMMEAATKRWGVKFLQYPSQNTVNALKDGMWCDMPPHVDELPVMSSWHIYAAAIRDTKIPLVLTGMKRADSQSRRRVLKWTAANKQVLHPVQGWQKIDVMSYLRLQKIPIPAGSGRQTSGLGELADGELLALYDLYPDDFKKLERYFKYIGAVVAHRRFYGSPP